MIPRRHLLALPCALAAQLRAAARTVRGRFVKGGTLVTPEGRRIKLDGDESARKVYDDERLEGVDFEVEGDFKGDVFVAEPIHKRPLWAWRNGERRMVSSLTDTFVVYFQDHRVVSIRKIGTDVPDAGSFIWHED